MSQSRSPEYQWLPTGALCFAAMLEAIQTASKSVRLETYIYHDDETGLRFRTALVAAALRGVRVQVLLDAFGSLELSGDFWEPLEAAGGSVRRFNPLSVGRFGFRNHRKLLVRDEDSAIVGGFNIAREYDGDGVLDGWLDLGLRVVGETARELSRSFDELFHHADYKHKRLMRFRKSPLHESDVRRSSRVLISIPGRGGNSIKRALEREFARGRDIRIMTAYFLPTWKLRRTLLLAARKGARVQLLVPGRTDSTLARLASQNLFHRLLRAGVEIHEYQPQILHAKLFLVEETVFVGSANLDTRSLSINYELLVRVQDAGLARQAHETFAQALEHSVPVTLAVWKKSRSYWRKLKERLAYHLLARVDPYVIRHQLKSFR
ncbi:MAG TPA: phospholipase D-like domain-containing protein [Methylomirabilota bacterium]|nr:phospholipase D-like domain-containing protein [Methylomirabilota bacterium]